MAKKLSFAASRQAGVRLFRWSVLALASVIGGIMLGEMAVGKRLGWASGEPASYADLSANPNALVPQGDGGIVRCSGCADSYGVAAGLRAERDNRMNDAFRELGAVDVDASLPDEPAEDDYRYGGRFPDQEPRTRDLPEPDRGLAATQADAPLDSAGVQAAEY